ncbi:MAG: hypothetical protein KY476_13190 [Planctomycetes bacterium]|nr:hypothetical protein [Planctomycetota bacterium]
MSNPRNAATIEEQPDASVKEPLQAELQQLETCLETPFVPGELEGWIGAVLEAWERLEQPFRSRFGEDHPQQFEEIAEADPELLTQVKHLREGDARVMERFRELQQRIRRLSPSVSRAEPDEKLVDDDLERLVDDGLAFVIETRKQEVATRTWLSEAFDRVRGAVD